MDSIFKGFDESKLPILDRPFDSEDLANVFRRFFSNGVFGNGSFAVTKSTGSFQVDVAAGECMVNGRMGVMDEPIRKITFTPPDMGVGGANNTRTDSIVLQLDLTSEVRDIKVYVKQGYYRNPPALTRNETIYELAVADVNLSSRKTGIDASDITDTRMDSSRCGIVTPLLEIDTTDFYNQLQAQTDKAVELAQKAIDETMYGDLDSKIAKMGEGLGSQIEKLDEGLDELSKSSPVPVADIVQAASGYTVATNTGGAYKYGKLLFVDMAITSTNTMNANSNYTIGNVKQPYVPIATSFLGTLDALAIVSPGSGNISIRPAVNFPAGERIWMRGVLLCA